MYGTPSMIYIYISKVRQRQVDRQTGRLVDRSAGRQVCRSAGRLIDDIFNRRKGNFNLFLYIPKFYDNLKKTFIYK